MRERERERDREREREREREMFLCKQFSNILFVENFNKINAKIG